MPKTPHVSVTLDAEPKSRRKKGGGVSVSVCVTVTARLDCMKTLALD